MRNLLIAALAALFLVPAARAADSATPFAFPATAAGRHAAAWFAAYAAGDAAVLAFWNAHASAATLAERSAEQRVQFLQRVRADFGALTPVSTGVNLADECSILARGEHGSVRIGFLCAPDAQHTLAGMRFEPEGEGPGGPGGPPQAGHGTPPAPPASGPAPTDAEITSTLAAQIDALVRTDAFSGAVLLQKNGVTLLERAAGMAYRPGREHNTLATRFNLGSLNKIFTHVAIEQLAEAGKLSLDDPVTHWLPDYKVANADHVTLRLLLDHKGGVPDMLMSPDFAAAPHRVRTMADWYALVRETPLRFEPGSRQEYSNGGFVLLGMVVAAASGQDYFDYVRDHVYAPAGMTDTGHFAIDSRTPRTATGYMAGNGSGEPDAGLDTLGGLVANTSTLPGRGSSAGGGYSTVGDLARFSDALRAGTLLDAAHVRDVFGDHFWLGIAGGSPGVNGLFVVAGPYTLVVLANRDAPTAEQFAPTIGRLVRRAAGIPPPPTPR
jgi:CubicO group peptidase (beta-lactamase class C family)